MKITYYNSAAYEKTTTEFADVILGNFGPDEMDDNERENLRLGLSVPMCNFATKDGRWKAVPWNFVIEIDEGG